MADQPRVAKRDWKPEDLLPELILESQYDVGDAPACTARLLREHALASAQSIAHLAMYAGNERVRMQAAQYIVDRTLNSTAEHDLKLQQAQVALVGQAIFATIRQLGMRFDFDPESVEVKTIAHETIMTLAVPESGE